MDIGQEAQQLMKGARRTGEGELGDIKLHWTKTLVKIYAL